MKKNAGSFVLLICGVLAIYMVGCGSFEEDAAFVRANPLDGSTIAPDNIITVTFDNTPVTVDVKIQGQRDTSFFWELDSKTLTVRGNPKFQFGKNYVMIITWATGRKILNYSVPWPPRMPKPPSPPPAAIVGVYPSSDKIAANAAITVTFDRDPGDVTANPGIVSGSGKTRIIAGPFRPGPMSLTISWTNDGGHTLAYNVTAPDIAAPRVIAGTVRNGDRDVNPRKINNAGKIEIRFNEEVTGKIVLQTEDGDDIGWIGRVEGNKGIFELVKGKEIGNNTTYVIRGKVLDAAGNKTEISITFVTK